MKKDKKLVNHEKNTRNQVRRTVDALTRITEADPIAFLTSVMQGKPFLAAHPKNPHKPTKIYPTREQRILVAMWLGSRVMPAAKGQAPAAGNVNVVIRSRHSDEPRPLNAPARFSQEIEDKPGVLIDATPTQAGAPEGYRRRHRADADADAGAEVEIQVGGYAQEPQEAQVRSRITTHDED